MVRSEGCGGCGVDDDFRAYEGEDGGDGGGGGDVPAVVGDAGETVAGQGEVEDGDGGGGGEELGDDVVA